MLNIVGDLMTEVLVRNNRTTTDGFITNAILQDWTRQAITWVCSYKKWPATEGRVSTTFASLKTSEDGYLVGEYPEGWKSDSIRLLTIGGKEVEKKNFYKFRKFVEDYPSDNDRVFTDFNRQYYVNPRIDLSGTVTCWGQYTPFIDVTDLSATTPFSGNEEEANEAIVDKMSSYLKYRENKGNEALVCEQSAKLKLNELWQRIQDEQFAYQQPKGDYGMWERVDILGGDYYSDTIKRDQFN
jgi:hypothetical protein